MAWTSADQNPSLSPGLSSPNYAAALNSSAYYNPLSGGSANTGMAPLATSVAPGSQQQNYADRPAAAAQAPWETRETSRELATSADRTNAARRYTKEVSTSPAGTMRRQGDRALDLLHPQAAQQFALAARVAQAEGIPVGIKSAYRPPGFGVGKMRDKSQSMHAYGLAFDVSGIGNPGSATSNRWHEIATEHGLFNPYWGKSSEWNHYQVVPTKTASQIPGLRDTITNKGPIDVERMWTASGVDPEGVPYAGNPFGVSGQNTMAGGTMPTPPRNPRNDPRMGTQGGRDTLAAYAPQPEPTKAPFGAVMGGAKGTKPKAVQTAPQAQGGAYIVKKGDNLSRIAQRELGNANRWREIAQANSIRDPNRIQPGQRLVMPGQTQSRAEVAMPTPPPRPDLRIERQKGGAPDASAVPSPRMRGAPAPFVDNEPSVPWIQRVLRPEGGPVIPKTRLEQAQEARIRPSVSLAARNSLGTPETQMSIDRPQPLQQPVGPVGNAGAVNWMGKGDRSTQMPAGPGMNTSGLIRERSPEESRLPMTQPNMTGGQPMDPQVAAQIRRTPAIITEVLPPSYVAPNGVQVWALR